MADAVARTFMHGGLLVVEAGTGVGKSLAYSIPAIRWSRENGQRVVISTNTINLQEQLIRRDLPFLQRHLGVSFTIALAKGRGNYLCLRKAAELHEQSSSLLDDGSQSEVQQILDWSRDTEDGSLADLPFVPRRDSWALVATEHDDCLRTRCPDYDACFFYRARRRAAEADLVVVNHHLLMADLALRERLPDDAASGVLPLADRLVIDEAHHLEDVATGHFGSEVTLRRIETVLRRLQHPRVPERGVLPRLMEKLLAIASPEDRPPASGAAAWIEERLRPRVAEIARSAAECFAGLLLGIEGSLPPSDGGAERSLRVVPALRATALWSDARRRILALATAIDSFVGDFEPVTARLGMLSEGAAEKLLFLEAQLRALAGRLLGVAADAKAFVEDDADLCRWFAIRRGNDGASVMAIAAAPVDVGPRLRTALFERFAAVVLTSATLTVRRSFDHFRARTGIDGLDSDLVDTLRLDSPYRFEEQALLAVPRDLPAPDAPGHEAALHEAIARMLEASGGGAFVLFTATSALLRAHAALAGRLRALGLSILRQGEATRHVLLERFRGDGSSVLFATSSFWEGVDVRGEGLRMVLIARLPFRVPSEPIVQARMEAITLRGGDPFDELTVPQAVIRLRQGFGRLIRSREDRGVVAILDSRFATRRYGAVFLESLPNATRVVDSTQAVVHAIGEFFR
ncbi:MAG: ATP-dependent helicase DinG [Candidatus Binatota bacterium]|nr:ATP-dependent helicase DinG [Candidatus Binatota bacterium]